MNRQQIEEYLVNEKKKVEARLDLLQKITTAVAVCRHHVSPSAKIATAFKKFYGEETYRVYWESGNQEKWEQRRLKVWGDGVHYDQSIDISTYPEKYTWDFVFDSLGRQEGWMKKAVSDLNEDLGMIDAYIDWDRIFKMSIAELRKAQPSAHGYLTRCFGEVEVKNNPVAIK